MSREIPLPIRGYSGRAGQRLGPLVGSSDATSLLFETIQRFGRSEHPVLILGESGVGKELVANALHLVSPRRTAPFVALNAATLGADLAASTLFGHVRGAFTGADRSRHGAFTTASKGTLFLDELAELPMPVQTALLRTLETGVVRPVGSDATLSTDARLVCATNADLWDRVEQDTFRADLLYRLDVLRIVVPPLRERLSDLDVLVPHLLSVLRAPMPVTDHAMHCLKQYHWPGNVRELRNVLARASVLGHSQETLTDIHVRTALQRRPMRRRVEEGERNQAFRQANFSTVSRRLRENRGNRRKTYQSLGIPRSTFYRWLREGKLDT